MIELLLVVLTYIYTPFYYSFFGWRNKAGLERAVQMKCPVDTSSARGFSAEKRDLSLRPKKEDAQRPPFLRSDIGENSLAKQCRFAFTALGFCEEKRDLSLRHTTKTVIGNSLNAPFFKRQRGGYHHAASHRLTISVCSSRARIS